MKNIFILAQAGEGEDNVITGGSGDDIAQENLTAEDGSNGGGDVEKAPPKSFLPLPLMIGLMVIVMFMFLRGPKKRQKQQQQMIQSLQRN